MHKSIRFKLFLAFIMTTMLVVAGMYVFMRWSLDRGFSELIETRQRERIELLVASLAENYAKSGSWETLSRNKRLWVDLLKADKPPHRHPVKWMDNTFNQSQSIWPPTLPERGSKRRFTPLELRVMLLHANKSIIYGRKKDLPSLTLYPIHHKQQTVGFLGLLPGNPVKLVGEHRFMERQANAFIWIAMLMIALSAGLAFLLAYNLGRPLKKITAAAKELGKGRYSMRLLVESSDELGQLAQDFNEMAAALEQAEQSRRRWIADISHELRTPLAVLRGELEALQDGIRPVTRGAIDSLFGDVMRLNRLTEDLYQLSLSDQGALTYRKTKLDPIVILKQSMTSLRSEIDNKQLGVRLINNAGIVNLYADEDRLAQLFRNLLKNSVNYTNKGGQLYIVISKKPDTLLIDISDSAPGVSEKERDKLFDRFYRVESSRNRNNGGAGLGLAICSNIVAAHNGIIKAQSSPLGGLTIHIELPIQV